MEIQRRQLLTGLVCFTDAAPAIVRADIKNLFKDDYAKAEWKFLSSNNEFLYSVYYNNGKLSCVLTQQVSYVNQRL